MKTRRCGDVLWEEDGDGWRKVFGEVLYQTVGRVGGWGLLRGGEWLGTFNLWLHAADYAEYHECRYYALARPGAATRKVEVKMKEKIEEHIRMMIGMCETQEAKKYVRQLAETVSEEIGKMEDIIPIEIQVAELLHGVHCHSEHIGKMCSWEYEKWKDSYTVEAGSVSPVGCGAKADYLRRAIRIINELSWCKSYFPGNADEVDRHCLSIIKIVLEKD